MAFYSTLKVPLTCDGSGAMTATSVAALTGLGVLPVGKLRKVRYVHASSGTMSNSSAITIVGALTGQSILSATVTTGGTDQEWCPLNPGAKSSDGTSTSTYVDVPLSEDVTVAVASGGASTTGTLYLIIGD